jgi:hypothetical protein
MKRYNSLAAFAPEEKKNLYVPALFDMPLS